MGGSIENGATTVPPEATAKCNAFRKFADVRFLLYICPEIGTYAGDVDTFSERAPTLADRLSGRMGGRGRSARGTEPGPSSRAQAARAPHAIAAGADVARDARHRDVGRAPVSVVSGAAGRQFLVRSTAAAALGDLCRADAARVAAARHGAPASRRVLARLAVGRPRRDPVQSDQHAADHRHAREGGDPSRPGGLREDDHRRVAGSGAAQPAGRRHRPQGRIRVGLGAATAGATAKARVVARGSSLWRDRLCPSGAAGVSAGRQSLPRLGRSSRGSFGGSPMARGSWASRSVPRTIPAA